MITLRAVEPEDWQWMTQVENDPDIKAYSCNYAPISASLMKEYASSYDADPYRAGQLRLVVTDGEDPIGIVDLYDIDAYNRHGHVGIVILKEYRGKDHATTALDLLARYCLDVLGFGVLAAVVDIDNKASRTLFSKAGYSEVGVLPRWHRNGHSYHDVLMFTLTLV